MLDEVEHLIKSTVSSQVRAECIISKHKIPREIMEREVFLKVVRLLLEIEDRADFLELELGIDIKKYEDNFFVVIDELLKLTFNKEQINLINNYLYTLVPNKEWKGDIMLEIDSDKRLFNIKTPEQLWEVLLILKG